MRCRRAVFVALALSAAGCVSREQIPRYSRMNSADSLRLIAERSAKVRTVIAEGTITLTRPGGGGAILDSAMVMQPPDRARIRAWKFGQAIFDLTLKPDGLWFVAPRESSRQSQITSVGTNAGELTRVWSLFAGRYFAEPLTVVSEGVERIFVRRALAGEPVMQSEIDRATLTPRKYELLDEHGAVRFSLTLDRYTARGDVVWPMRMQAVSAAGEILIEQRTVEINSSLADGAFVPPRRAEKLP